MKPDINFIENSVAQDQLASEQDLHYFSLNTWVNHF